MGGGQLLEEAWIRSMKLEEGSGEKGTFPSDGTCGAADMGEKIPLGSLSYRFPRL